MRARARLKKSLGNRAGMALTEDVPDVEKIRALFDAQVAAKVAAEDSYSVMSAAQYEQMCELLDGWDEPESAAWHSARGLMRCLATVGRRRGSWRPSTS